MDSHISSHRLSRSESPGGCDFVQAFTHLKMC